VDLSEVFLHELFIEELPSQLAHRDTSVPELQIQANKHQGDLCEIFW
jgi:hypothetical protein